MIGTLYDPLFQNKNRFLFFFRFSDEWDDVSPSNEKSPGLFNKGSEEKVLCVTTNKTSPVPYL